MTIPYNLQLKPPLGTPLNRGHKLAEGLVGFWLLNEGSGNKVFDLSGNRNEGTLIGSTHFVPGKFGSVLDFDGTGDYVSLVTDSIDVTGTKTVSMWFKLDTVSGTKGLFYGENTGADADPLAVGMDGNRIILQATLSQESTLKSSILSIGVWYHLVVAKETSTAKYIYINGIDDTVGPASYFGGFTTGIHIGNVKVASGTNLLLNGQIANISIYDRILSPSEIALLYREPFCMFKDPAEIALLGGFVEEIEGWIGIGSAHLDSHCGGQSPAAALDAEDWWWEGTEHTHWFIVDLGQTYNVQKVRGRSNYSGYDPIDINIYVSDNKESFGAAVASGISTWYDTDIWQEVDTVDKNGRYVKVEIVETEDGVSKPLSFGQVIPFITIFDVYVGEEVVPPVGMAGAMTTNAGYWGW